MEVEVPKLERFLWSLAILLALMAWAYPPLIAGALASALGAAAAHPESEVTRGS